MYGLFPDVRSQVYWLKSCTCQAVWHKPGGVCTCGALPEVSPLLQVRPRLLGSGGYGSVFAVRTRFGVVAVKVYHEGRWRSFKRESEVLQVLHPHPNVVGFLGVLDESPTALVMECIGEPMARALASAGDGDAAAGPVSGTEAGAGAGAAGAGAGAGSVSGSRIRGFSLSQYLHDRSCLPGAVEYGGLWRVVTDVARALVHTHGAGYVHRDVKPANVLVEVERSSGGKDSLLLRGVLADFGQAAKQGTWSPHGCGTPVFQAPEQVVPHEPDSHCVLAASDVWSFGLLVMDVFGGPPSASVPLDRAQKAAEALARSKPMPITELHQLTLDVARDCRRMALCHCDGEKRWGAVPLLSALSLAEWCMAPRACHRPAMTQVLAALEESTYVSTSTCSSAAGAADAGVPAPAVAVLMRPLALVQAAQEVAKRITAQATSKPDKTTSSMVWVPCRIQVGQVAPTLSLYVARELEEDGRVRVHWTRYLPGHGAADVAYTAPASPPPKGGLFCRAASLPLVTVVDATGLRRADAVTFLRSTQHSVVPAKQLWVVMVDAALEVVHRDLFGRDLFGPAFGGGGGEHDVQAKITGVELWQNLKAADCKADSGYDTGRVWELAGNVAFVRTYGALLWRAAEELWAALSTPCAAEANAALGACARTSFRAPWMYKVQQLVDIVGASADDPWLVSIEVQEEMVALLEARPGQALVLWLYVDMRFSSTTVQRFAEALWLACLQVQRRRQLGPHLFPDACNLLAAASRYRFPLCARRMATLASSSWQQLQAVSAVPSTSLKDPVLVTASLLYVWAATDEFEGQGLTAIPGSKTMEHAVDLMAWEQGPEDGGVGRDLHAGMVRLTRLVLASFHRLQCSPHAATAMYRRAMGSLVSGSSDSTSLPVIYVPAAVDEWVAIFAATEAATETEAEAEAEAEVEAEAKTNTKTKPESEVEAGVGPGPGLGPIADASARLDDDARRASALQLVLHQVGEVWHEGHLSLIALHHRLAQCQQKAAEAGQVEDGDAHDAAAHAWLTSHRRMLQVLKLDHAALEVIRGLPGGLWSSRIAKPWETYLPPVGLVQAYDTLCWALQKVHSAALIAPELIGLRESQTAILEPAQDFDKVLTARVGGSLASAYVLVGRQQDAVVAMERGLGPLKELVAAERTSDLRTSSLDCLEVARLLHLQATLGIQSCVAAGCWSHAPADILPLTLKALAAHVNPAAKPDSPREAFHEVCLVSTALVGALTACVPACADLGVYVQEWTAMYAGWGSRVLDVLRWPPDVFGSPEHMNACVHFVHAGFRAYAISGRTALIPVFHAHVVHLVRKVAGAADLRPMSVLCSAVGATMQGWPQASRAAVLEAYEHSAALYIDDPVKAELVATCRLQLALPAESRPSTV